MGKKHDIV